MKTNTFTLATLALIAGTAATLGGCANDTAHDRSSSHYTGTAPHARPGADYHPGSKPEPKAMADNTDKSKPMTETRPMQPSRAPMAAGGSVMYIPTGERSTSALMIEKIYPSQVTVGQPFDYIIKATNISSQALNNVTVTEAAPTNFTLASSTPQAGAGGVYNLGTLNPGESKMITMKGAAAGTGRIDACASATYTSALCSTINVVQPALAITKQMTPEAILNCTPINMTITVKNSGSGTASNVHVTDTLPAGLTLASGGTSFDENLGDIAAGTEKTITKEIKASSVGKFDNTAVAKADGLTAVTSTKVTTVIKQPKLELTCKTGGKVMLNRNACYELTIKNTGDATSQATKISVTLPATAVIATMSDGGANNVFNIGDLAPGASKTVNLCLKSGTLGAIPLSAAATGNCATPSSTTCSIDVQGSPDIGTQVTDDDGVVAIGDEHIYRVEVQNQGQIVLTNTRLTVTLPAGMSFVRSASASAGKLNDKGEVVFDFGTVQPGARPKGDFVVKSSKSGEMLVVGVTTCNELKTPIRDDELTNFIEK